MTNPNSSNAAAVMTTNDTDPHTVELSLNEYEGLLHERAEIDALRAEVQFFKSQNEQLHQQLNEIRRVVWEGPGTAQIMNKLRNMMDRPK